MTIDIIGAGRIGASVAEQPVCRGHEAVVSFTRDPKALNAVAEKTGARAGSVARPPATARPSSCR